MDTGKVWRRTSAGSQRVPGTKLKHCRRMNAEFLTFPCINNTVSMRRQFFSLLFIPRQTLPPPAKNSWSLCKSQDPHRPCLGGHVAPVAAKPLLTKQRFCAFAYNYVLFLLLIPYAASVCPSVRLSAQRQRAQQYCEAAGNAHRRMARGPRKFWSGKEVQHSCSTPSWSISN